MWVNDPNGLVYFEGEYHLFYQHHPESTVWGPMHWGHAVSTDLVSWKHLPVALYPDENGYIFSGSVVVDLHNTAGFGANALVAIFTHHLEGRQSQSVAFSLDRGRTWQKYAANPVLLAPEGRPDFRDPKVFWYGTEEAGHWVMALAAGDCAMFFISANLIDWTFASSFGPAGSNEGVWETPDLFELPLADGQGTRWVLTIGVGAGGPAGGSGTQYFIGYFDGRRFISENDAGCILWADYGADFYAPQSWYAEPHGRRVVTAWQNNWRYANTIPAAEWRGGMSLPRQLFLQNTAAGIRLVQRPVEELQKLRTDCYSWRNLQIRPAENLLAGVTAEYFELEACFEVQPLAESFGFRLRVGESQAIVLTYWPQKQVLSVDASLAGRQEFDALPPLAHSAELVPQDGQVRLHLFVDATSLELFANNGLVCFSELIFPAANNLGMEVFSTGAPVILESLQVYPIG